MASFDENGKYIKTNWKAGDKITATKLNKIEESIEAVNENDISRYDEMRDKFIILEAKDAEHDKELADIKDLVSNNKANTDLEIQSLDSNMNTLESEVDTLESEVDALESGVQTLESEVAELKATDAAVKNDMENSQTQTHIVSDAYKFVVDHEGMVSSLMTLNNIEGSSSVEANSFGDPLLVSRYLKNICTVDTSKNYFEDATDFVDEYDATHTLNDNTLNVKGPYGWSAVKCHIPNLVEGRKYCVICDNIQINSGGSAFQCLNGLNSNLSLNQSLNSLDIHESGLSYVFVYNVREDIVRFHCALGNDSGGDVTYENIQIYEVKEMIVPDIQLNSLPNGVKDEIKDGMLIKRTKYVNLAELTWNPSSTNNTDPNSEFVVYYTLSTTDLIVDPDAWENELGHILCNNIPSVPIIVTNSAASSDASNNRVGIAGHKEWSEIRIKLYKSDVPDLAALKTWLTENKVYAVYELGTPEYFPINTTIKVDKDDLVVINTIKKMDLTYDIQLNTRAQIDSVQDLVSSHKHNEYLPLSGGTITGDFNPAGGQTCNLGGDTNRWQSLYLNEGPDGVAIDIGSSTNAAYSSVNFNRTMDGVKKIIKFGASSFNKVPCPGIITGPVDGGETVTYIFLENLYAPTLTNTVNLGRGDLRWKTVYSVNADNVSSDRSMKENIKYVGKNKSDLNYKDMYSFVKNDLELATYNFIGQKDKLSMNFIAQDLLVNEDGTDNKVGQMIVNPVAVPTEEEIAEGIPYPTLSYDTGMYTSVLAGALKEAINKIEQLEARIQELENK